MGLETEDPLTNVLWGKEDSMNRITTLSASTAFNFLKESLSLVNLNICSYFFTHLPQILMILSNTIPVFYTFTDDTVKNQCFSKL